MDRHAEDCTLRIGSVTPYFSLKGTDGRIYNLHEFERKRVLVVIFTSNHCPYVTPYDRTLYTMSMKYLEEGAQFIAICSNDSASFPSDSFEAMLEKSQLTKMPYPYLHDDTQVAARAFDAACTPECYVFDEKRVLRYHGRIDDGGMYPENASRPNLQNAISALLRGDSVEIPLTPVTGCSIKWKR